MPQRPAPIVGHCRACVVRIARLGGIPTLPASPATRLGKLWSRLSA
jgi:hypothetical protein